MEPVDGVVVGGHGLGVAVDHDRFEALGAEPGHRLDTAGVELDPLADPHRSATEDDHRSASRAAARRGRRSCRRDRAFGPRTRRRRCRPGAGSGAARDRVGAAVRSRGRFPEAAPVELSAKPSRLAAARVGSSSSGSRSTLSAATNPPIRRRNQGSTAVISMRRSSVQPRRRPSASSHSRSGEGMASRAARPSSSSRREIGGRLERVAVDLERADRLEQRLLEGAPHGGDLADRLHGGAEDGLGAGELLEGEARDLDDHIVEGGLERRRRRAGDVVGDLVETAAEGDLGRDPGDRESPSPWRPAPRTARPAGSSR